MRTLELHDVVRMYSVRTRDAQVQWARTSLRYVKGQHLSWMAYERAILSVKRTNSESKGKRLEVGWEAGSLSLRNFIGFLLPSPYPGQVKSDWECVKNTRKESMVQ